ncbi:hypothetical protein ACJRO7_002223 [Eucalyptus globulus]|uniref:Carboxypeptidase n=1 Tax=Eucalyptus globulus TaxID=34317 RepID=A0ABD3LUR5_EUCGL
MHPQLVPWLMAATLTDKIVSLPGQPKVSFSQYAGYITVDEKQQRALFYYFAEAEAEADPASKPLVLWLNGVEHGPFKPSGDVLLKNDYSWSKKANMLYLESPAGVGFSSSVDNTYYNSVDNLARDNLAILHNWFEKFPEYKERDLFITGENYAGHYVPQLAMLIVRSRLFNFKGIAFNTNFNSRAEFFWSRRLISDATYESFNTKCNYSQILRQAQSSTITPVCSRIASEAKREISRFINTYNVTLDVCLSIVSSQSAVLNTLQETEKIDVCIEDETVDVLRYEYQNLEIPTISILVELVNGDQDSAIPLPGTRTRTLVNNLAKELGLNIIKNIVLRTFCRIKTRNQPSKSESEAAVGPSTL